jgi:membrane protein YdbS with pleckstrin-like domain
MDETETLTPLDPSYIKVMRIVGALFSVPLLIGAATLEFAQLLPPGLIIIPLVLLLAYWVWVVPQRRYNRWGYDAGADRLRIERGYFTATRLSPLAVSSISMSIRGRLSGTTIWVRYRCTQLEHMAARLCFQA